MGGGCVSELRRMDTAVSELRRRLFAFVTILYPFTVSSRVSLPPSLRPRLLLPLAIIYPSIHLSIYYLPPSVHGSSFPL